MLNLDTPSSLCLVIALRLLGHHLVIAWSFLGHYLVIAWSLLGHCLILPRSLLCHCLVLDHCLVIDWSSLGLCLVIYWYRRLHQIQASGGWLNLFEFEEVYQRRVEGKYYMIELRWGQDSYSPMPELWQQIPNS
jgi:hypothetical protein